MCLKNKILRQKIHAIACMNDSIEAKNLFFVSFRYQAKVSRDNNPLSFGFTPINVGAPK